MHAQGFVGDVFLINADGTGLVQLTNDPADDFGAQFSPDGRKIAFTSDRDGEYQTYLMNPDGSGAVNLTNDLSVADLEPRWSPNGHRLVFYSTRAGAFEIFAMNIDGTGPLLASSSTAASRPAVTIPILLRQVGRGVRSCVIRLATSVGGPGSS